MIILEPFERKDIKRLIDWVTSEEDLLQFAGTFFKYPLNEMQLNNYLELENQFPHRIKLQSTGQIIGHCELNFSNQVPRLSRILIGEKEFRNKGLGKIIVGEMVKMILQKKKCDAIDLIVFDWNTSAINCYKNLGFGIVDNWEDIVFVNNNKWRAVKMQLLIPH